MDPTVPARFMLLQFPARVRVVTDVCRLLKKGRPPKCLSLARNVEMTIALKVSPTSWVTLEFCLCNSKYI